MSWLLAFVTVEHVSPPENAMSLIGFDPENPHTVSHRSSYDNIIIIK
jgi:hypothetical protein